MEQHGRRKSGEETMSDPASAPKWDPSILAAPLYVAGTHIDTVKERYGLQDLIKLASNENPLGPSPKAMAAIQEALPRLFRYPPVDAVQLRQELADGWGRGLAGDSFVTGNGATEILAMITLGFLNRGDESIICRPTFPMYAIFTHRRGATAVWADLDASFLHNIDRVLAAVSDRTRLILVCCPNNPTGTVMTPGDADRLVREVPPDVVTVFDESYRLFATDVELPDTIRYVREGRNVIVVNSMSKAYGLAGLRFGYAIARQEIAEYLRRLQHPFHLSELALRGARAALDDVEHTQRTQALITTERDWLQARLDELGLFYIPSQGNFVALKPGYPADLVYERMLQRGVIIRPLRLFDMPDFIRVSIGARPENERFLQTLRETLSELEELPVEMLWPADRPADKVMV
jgi:histidinol-phosphate aminotransferase